MRSTRAFKGLGENEKKRIDEKTNRRFNNGLGG